DHLRVALGREGLPARERDRVKAPDSSLSVEGHIQMALAVAGHFAGISADRDGLAKAEGFHVQVDEAVCKATPDFAAYRSKDLLCDRVIDQVRRGEFQGCDRVRAGGSRNQELSKRLVVARVRGKRPGLDQGRA